MGDKQIRIERERKYKRFVELYNQGMSKSLIAEKLNLTTSAICGKTYLKRLEADGGKYVPKGNFPTENTTKIDNALMMDLVHQIEDKYEQMTHAPESDPQLQELRRVVNGKQNKQPRVERLRARIEMITSKQKREYAQSRGYRSWFEMVHDQELTTLEVHRIEKMIERES